MKRTMKNPTKRPMKRAMLAIAFIAAVAVAMPAEAASKKRKQAAKPQHKPPVVAVQHDPYEVIDFDGRVAGRDPDPNIRAAIRRDPRPWEGID